MSTNVQLLVAEDGDRVQIARYIEEFEIYTKEMNSGYEVSSVYVSTPEEFKESLFDPENFFPAIFVHERFPEKEDIVRLSREYMDKFDMDREKSLQIYNDDKLRKALEPTRRVTKYLM